MKEYDSFEDGDYTSEPSWIEIQNSGTASVQSSVVARGSNSLELDGGGFNDIRLEYDRNSNDGIKDGDTYQFWVRVTDLYSDQQNYWYLSNTSGDEKGNDAIWVSVSDNIQVYTEDSTGNDLDSGTLYSSSNSSVDTWYRIEVEFDTTNENVNLRIFQSMTQQNSITLNYSGASNIQYLGIQASCASGQTTYWDDVSYNTLKREDWTYDAPGSSSAFPTVSADNTGNIYWAAGDMAKVGQDANEKWTDTRSSSIDGIVATSDGSGVFIVKSNDEMEKIDPQDGSKIWTYNSFPGQPNGIATDGTYVWVSGQTTNDEGWLQKISISSKDNEEMDSTARQWEYNDSSLEFYPVAVDGSENSYVGKVGEVEKIDSTGSSVGVLNAATGVVLSVDVTDDGSLTLYGTDNNKAWLFDVSNGTYRWDKTMNGAWIYGVALDDATRTAYAIGDQGRIRRYDIDTGEIIWQYSDVETGFLSGTIDGESPVNVYAGVKNPGYKLYKIEQYSTSNAYIKTSDGDLIMTDNGEKIKAGSI